MVLTLGTHHASPFLGTQRPLRPCGGRRARTQRGGPNTVRKPHRGGKPAKWGGAREGFRETVEVQQKAEERPFVQRLLVGENGAEVHNGAM